MDYTSYGAGAAVSTCKTCGAGLGTGTFGTLMPTCEFGLASLCAGTPEASVSTRRTGLALATIHSGPPCCNNALIVSAQLIILSGMNDVSARAHKKIPSPRYLLIQTIVTAHHHEDECEHRSLMVLVANSQRRTKYVCEKSYREKN